MAKTISVDDCIKQAYREIGTPEEVIERVHRQALAAAPDDPNANAMLDEEEARAFTNQVKKLLLYWMDHPEDREQAKAIGGEMIAQIARKN